MTSVKLYGITQYVSRSENVLDLQHKILIDSVCPFSRFVIVYPCVCSQCENPTGKV